MGNKGTIIVIFWTILQGGLGQECSPGFRYDDTSGTCQDIDECNPEDSHVGPCNGMDRIRCDNSNGGYTCKCPYMGPGTKYGPYCNSSIAAADMMCAGNEDGCYNNGSCQNFEKCNCRKGFSGKYCEIQEMDNCPMMCWNNGTCGKKMLENNTMSMPYCMCPPGFRGEMCQYRLDLCNQTENICLNGGTCMPDMDPPCKCMPNFKGDYCEENDMVNLTCQECRENGTLPNQIAMCNDNETLTSCPCEHGFYGTFCQFTMKNCSNGGVDVPIPPPGFSRCVCPEGVDGPKCDNDVVNECSTDMCQNGANCIDMPGYYMCNCTPGYMGQNCEYMDPNVHPPTTPRPSTCMMNNLYCPLGQEPWVDCRNYTTCQTSFLNGICNPECDNEFCLYDGFDCLNMTMNCTESRCPLLFDNGRCDAECQVPECGGDQHDCLTKEDLNMLRLGTLVLDVNITNLSEISENISSEALFLSKALPYRLSNTHMVNMFVRKRGRNERGGIPMITSRNTSTGDMIYRAYYDVANRKGCNDTCWMSIQSFARYFAAAEDRRMDYSMPYGLNRVLACMEGYFGENCTSMCSRNCQMMSGTPACDMEDGSCTLGCKNTSYVGLRCDVMCSPNCLANMCNDDGTCSMTSQGRCKPGYMGARCDMPCTNGTYGTDCDKACDAKCTGMCDKRTGQCLCVDGYFNYGLTVGMCLVCKAGYYGRNCSSMCSKNCNTMTCNATNGDCAGCSKGYRGRQCDQKCGTGKYGENCAQNCSKNCHDMKCNHVTGQCVSCVQGYAPPSCQKKASGSGSGTGKVTQDYSSTVIAVIVVLVILLVVALGVAYFLWRRSQGGKYETNEMEQGGLVMTSLNNKSEEPRKNNEYADMPKATENNEEAKGDIEKAPLISEGQEFESIDLKTPPADTNQNLNGGGVFDGGPADPKSDPFARKEEGKGEDESSKPDIAKTEEKEPTKEEVTPDESKGEKPEEKGEENPKSEGEDATPNEQADTTESNLSTVPSPLPTEDLTTAGEEGKVAEGGDVKEEDVNEEPINNENSSSKDKSAADENAHTESKDSGDSSKTEDPET